MKPNQTQKRLRILIVDDHPAVREALVSRIDRQPDMEVCGEAADIHEALQVLAETHPDLVIVDITLKSGNGIDLIKRIKGRDEDIRLLVWSMHSESLYCERALRAGALGYVNKDQATSIIIEAIRQVAAGKVYLSPQMSETLLHRAVGSRSAPLERSPVETLSDRELQVFRLIGQGVKTAEIAKQMHVSIGTIWTYRDRIREKLDLGDGTKLVHYATQWELDNS